jgi:hypothetical protein
MESSSRPLTIKRGFLGACARETDENGEATIHCFNASKSTFLTISAETIHDGQPASLNIHSIGLDESKTDHLQ